jgi:hypothetical protein
MVYVSSDCSSGSEGQDQERPLSGQGPGRTWVSMTRVFLFPLLIVVVGVLVYLFFIASAQDNRSVEELISDIESGGPHARKQDLFALSLKVRDLPIVDGKPTYFSESVTRKLLGLLERTKEEDLRGYLIRATGRGGEPAMTAPIMKEIALGDERSEASRVYAVQSLGLSASPEARDILLEVLRRFDQPENWELRWYALAGLVNMADPASVAPLRGALAEPRREIRWSAACWLAVWFKDSSGVDILRDLIDWKVLDQERGDHDRPLLPDEKEAYMVMAMEGLYGLDRESARPLLEEKKLDSRSPRVRNAAFEMLAMLEAGAPAPAPRPIQVERIGPTGTLDN